MRRVIPVVQKQQQQRLHPANVLSTHHTSHKTGVPARCPLSIRTAQHPLCVCLSSPVFSIHVIAAPIDARRARSSFSFSKPSPRNGTGWLNPGAVERLCFLNAMHYGREDAPYLGMYHHRLRERRGTLCDSQLQQEQQQPNQQNQQREQQKNNTDSTDELATKAVPSDEQQQDQPQQQPQHRQSHHTTISAAAVAVSDAEIAARRELYVRALLAITGEGRRGRDWLAGWAALMPSENAHLVELCVQCPATKDSSDVDALLANVAQQYATGEITVEERRTLYNCFTFDAATMISRSLHLEDSEEKRWCVGNLVAFAEKAGLERAYVMDILALAEDESNLQIDKWLALESECTEASPGYASPWSSIDM